MAKPRLKVSQDGSNFYLYRKDTLIATMTIPRKCRDFDLTTAQQARKEFMELMNYFDIDFQF